MRSLKYLLVLTIVFASCKSNKNMIDSNAIAREMSARKIVKKHIASNFDKETIDAKFKANFDNGKTKQSISVYLKIKKDEVIWLKGTKFISVFKAKITPNSVSFYSPLERKYFEGDFSMIKNLLGTDINFQQLQQIFLGQAIDNLDEKKHDVEIVNNTYVLKPQSSDGVLHKHFAVNPSHFKLDFQSIINVFKDQMLSIKYPSYKLVGDEIFPQEINIEAKEGKKSTKIDFELKSVEFNTEINTSFTVPGGYKRIVL